MSAQALDDAGNAFVDPDEDAEGAEEPEEQLPLAPVQLRCELQIYNTGARPTTCIQGSGMTTAVTLHSLCCSPVFFTLALSGTTSPGTCSNLPSCLHHEQCRY